MEWRESTTHLERIPKATFRSDHPNPHHHHSQVYTSLQDQLIIALVSQTVTLAYIYNILCNFFLFYVIETKQLGTLFNQGTCESITET